MQSACAVLYCHVWPVWLYHIFTHYLINGTIFGKKFIEQKCVFRFSLQLLSETFLIIRRIQRDITINVHRCSCKVPLLLSNFNETWIFSTDFRKKNPQISNFMKIRPVTAELFHGYRRTKTDMTKLIVAFRNFANAPKNWHAGGLSGGLINQLLNFKLPNVYSHCYCYIANCNSLATHVCKQSSLRYLTATSPIVIALPLTSASSHPSSI
jgi:hypothetical protein